MYQINMYLETSIKGIKKTIGWYGYVVEWFNSRAEARTREDFKCEVGVTPNMLSLIAFLAALDRIVPDSEITVYTDNLYLREGYTQYLQVWKTNGWKTAHGDAIKNMALWQEIAEKTARHAIRFEKECHHSYKNWMVSQIQERKMKK